MRAHTRIAVHNPRQRYVLHGPLGLPSLSHNPHRQLVHIPLRYRSCTMRGERYLLLVSVFMVLPVPLRHRSCTAAYGAWLATVASTETWHQKHVTRYMASQIHGISDTCHVQRPRSARPARPRHSPPPARRPPPWPPQWPSRAPPPPPPPAAAGHIRRGRAAGRARPRRPRCGGGGPAGGPALARRVGDGGRGFSRVGPALVKVVKGTGQRRGRGEARAGRDDTARRVIERSIYSMAVILCSTELNKARRVIYTLDARAGWTGTRRGGVAGERRGRPAKRRGAETDGQDRSQRAIQTQTLVCLQCCKHFLGPYINSCGQDRSQRARFGSRAVARIVQTRATVRIREAKL